MEEAEGGKENKKRQKEEAVNWKKGYESEDIDCAITVGGRGGIKRRKGRDFEERRGGGLFWVIMIRRKD